MSLVSMKRIIVVGVLDSYDAIVAGLFHLCVCVCKNIRERMIEGNETLRLGGGGGGIHEK